MAGYRQFHGLSRPAFGKAVSREFLLVYPQLEELEADLDELRLEGGIGLLTGEMGIGKTTALRHFLEGLPGAGLPGRLPRLEPSTGGGPPRSAGVPRRRANPLAGHSAAPVKRPRRPHLARTAEEDAACGRRCPFAARRLS